MRETSSGDVCSILRTREIWRNSFYVTIITEPTLSVTVKPSDYDFNVVSDARVYSWPLMSGPLTVLTITLTYIYFVTSLGPNIMKNRKPYKLKNILIVYNVSQIVLCIYLFHRVRNIFYLYLLVQLILFVPFSSTK